MPRRGGLGGPQCAMNDGDTLPVPNAGAAPQAGGRVGGRYVLERPLGRGGMGEVWYARDEQSGGPVALKFVRVEGGVSPSAPLRTRQAREARAAQRIRHPRVVELYGVVEEEGHGPVLVMQYLEGEPLSERLERAGALSLAEVAPLAIDLCDGLSAAHAAGVVHRDLKPSNVLLVPGDGGVRPCIVDFGVAKLLSTTLEAVSSTAGGFAGTPIYMAPEQLFGEGDVDHRADLWSLGLVLYASLTGQTPTAGENLGQVLKKVLEQPLPRASSFLPSLPAEVDKMLARLLARERSARPALPEVAAAFAPFAGREVPAMPAPKFASQRVSDAGGASGPFGLATTVGDESRAPVAVVAASTVRPGPRGSKARFVVAAAVALGAVGLAARYPAALRELASPAAEARRVRSFAVLAPAGELSPDAAAAETLARALSLAWAASAEVRVVPPEIAARAPAARALLAAPGAAAARAAAEALGVDALVLVRAPAPASADANAPLASLTLYAAPDDFRAADALALGPSAGAPELLGAPRLVRERFGLRDGGAAASALASLGLPSASLPLARALRAQRALRRGDLGAARRELDAEGPSATEAPALHLARAQLKAAEGRDGEAQALASEALAASAGLARDEHLALEAEAHRLAFDFDRAIEAYRALWATRPEALEHGLRLAEVLVAASRLAEATEVLGQVTERQPADEGGRVGELLGLALFRLGEGERAARELAPSLERAERAGNSGAAARACLTLSSLHRTDDLAKAREYAERGRALYASAGDAVGVVRAGLAAADALLRAERFDEAIAAMNQARRDAPAGGGAVAETHVRALEVELARFRGDLEKARGLAESELASARSTGNKPLISHALNGLAGLTLDLGDGNRAAPILLDAIALAKGMGDKHSAARALSNLALVHHNAGELFRAREVAEESVRLYREVRDHYDIAWALDALGLVELAAARPAEARKLFEEALGVRKDNGLVGGQSRLNLATAHAYEGHLAEAVATCQQAVDEFRGQGQDGQEANALMQLADMLLEAGEHRRSRVAADRALALGDEGTRRSTAESLAPVLAELEFAAGDRSAPDRLARAIAAGRVAEEQRLWARLSLGRLWVRGGQRARGRAALTELAADARRSGQREVLRRAERELNANR